MTNQTSISPTLDAAPPIGTATVFLSASAPPDAETHPAITALERDGWDVHHGISPDGSLVCMAHQDVASETVAHRRLVDLGLGDLGRFELRFAI